MPLPLDNIKVLDISRGVAASFCTMILAEYGAEVIKIEAPGGDTIRYMPPCHEGSGTHFLAINRNKKSIELDIAGEPGRAEFMRMVSEADIVVDNFRPGVLSKIKLDHDSLRAINKKIISCSVSSFGSEGGWKNKPCHDINIMGLSGMLAGLASPDGAPSVPVPFIAAMAGGSLWAAIGILLALRQREKTGEGVNIDISMFHGLLSIMTPEIITTLLTGETQLPGNTWNSGQMPTCNIYKTKDGKWITLGAMEPKFWKNFCEVFERPDLIPLGFPHFTEKEKTAREIENIISSRTINEIIKLNDAKEIVIEPVNTIETAIKTQQVKDAGILYYIRSGQSELPQIKLPVKFSTPCPENPPPRQGEHNAEYLAGK